MSKTLHLNVKLAKYDLAAGKIKPWTDLQSTNYHLPLMVATVDYFSFAFGIIIINLKTNL